MKKLIIIVTILTLNISCCINENISEKMLKKCVNTTVNKYSKKYSGKPEFDFYVFIKKMENVLKKEGLIREPDQENYYKMLTELLNKNDTTFKKAYNQQLNVVYKFGYSDLAEPFVFTECPIISSAYLKNEEGKRIFQQATAMEKILKSGYYNKKSQELIKELVYSVDKKSFKNVLYRAPIILLTYKILQYKYDILLEINKKHNINNKH